MLKIIEHTSDTIVIRDCPGRMLLAGLSIIAIAGAALAGLEDSYASNGSKINEYVAILVLLFSLVGLVIGGCIIYDHHLTYTKFNKDLNTAIIQQVGVLKIENRSYRLDEIEDIIITESRSPEDICFYNVALKLKDNRKIPITCARPLKDPALKDNSDAVREFLNTKTWQFLHSRIYELLSLSCRAT